MAWFVISSTPQVIDRKILKPFQGLAGKPIHGGTTISGTMILSQLAGIKIFGTGGLGKFDLAILFEYPF